MTSTITITRPARKQKSYAERTGQNSRATKILARAVNAEKPVFVEDQDGHRMREWKPEEMQLFKHDDIARVLYGRRVVEPEDFLEFVPVSGMKYAATKGWIKLIVPGGYYVVTKKGAFELKLPNQVRGRKIHFVD
jgi:hypothetical protein